MWGGRRGWGGGGVGDGWLDLMGRGLASKQGEGMASDLGGEKGRGAGRDEVLHFMTSNSRACKEASTGKL